MRVLKSTKFFFSEFRNFENRFWQSRSSWVEWATFYWCTKWGRSPKWPSKIHQSHMDIKKNFFSKFDILKFDSNRSDRVESNELFFIEYLGRESLQISSQTLWIPQVAFFFCFFSENFGDYSLGDTPLPISNREVKTQNADGTACAGAWESR